MYNWLEKVLKNEYRMIRNIKNTDDNQIKVLENINTGNRVLMKKYRGECKAYMNLLKCSNANLPTIYEAVHKDGESIVVEEYIDGVTVADVLETGLYTEEGAAKIIYGVCSALTYLHKNGIIHRDIKPENIMVNNSGEVKLIDFNISRINEGSEEKNRDTVILGTTGFAAPEQYGIARTDSRTDIYALGILINVMLTGEHPSKKMCEGRWKKIVSKCTQINPDERYESVEEIMKVM